MTTNSSSPKKTFGKLWFIPTSLLKDASVRMVILRNVKDIGCRASGKHTTIKPSLSNFPTIYDSFLISGTKLKRMSRRIRSRLISKSYWSSSKTTSKHQKLNSTPFAIKPWLALFKIWIRLALWSIIQFSASMDIRTLGNSMKIKFLAIKLRRIWAWVSKQPIPETKSLSQPNLLIFSLRGN